MPAQGDALFVASSGLTTPLIHGEGDACLPVRAVCFCPGFSIPRFTRSKRIAKTFAVNTRRSVLVILFQSAHKSRR